MTIKYKLALSFVIMILLVAAVGVFMLLSNRLREEYSSKTVETIVVSNMVKEISFFIDLQFDAVDYYILLEDQEEKRKFEEYHEVINGRFTNWYNLVRDEMLKQEIIELEQIYADTILLGKKVISVQMRGNRREAINLMDKTFIPMDRELRKRFEILVYEKAHESEEVRKKSQAIMLQQTSISFGVILFAVVMGGILAVVIFNSVTRPLNDLKRGAAEIGKGNFDYVLEIKNKDEFGDLARSFNEMAGNVKKMQAQIIQLDRMSSMGQLAGGVAHELNNPLTGVLGQAQVLLTRIPKDNPIYEQVSKIERAALRCRKIVRELLDFSRQKEYIFQLTDINELIESTLLLCESDLHASQVQVLKDFAGISEPAPVSPPHLQQVFLNLITNAMQAMRPGGTLKISTLMLAHGFTVKDRRKNNGDLTMHGRWLEVRFSDTGMGIDQKHIDHVFDPFFTTKDVGKGTGLGLTISYGIIQNHKGSITVESKGQGEGATFIVRLPYDRSHISLT